MLDAFDESVLLRGHLEQAEPSGEVFFEEGEYDEESMSYEREGTVPTFELGPRRVALIE